ncbi:collagen alpha-6(VI) chain [Struthio camelus]|uniref:collagen alpha-6(VI) chain n=1 Tax=Struthio camelus TaxID=8801 RepID=UPI0036041CB8
MKMLLALFFLLGGTHTSVPQDFVPADIVLLVDSSEAMENSSLPYVKEFMIQMINSLPIGPKQFRLALAQYSDNVSFEFMLDTYGTKSSMVNHIKKNFTFTGGSSVQTGTALQKAYEMFFKESAGRKERQQIIVILTSAPSEDDIKEASMYLQSLGVKIIAIGTKEAPYSELFEMATQPFHYKNPLIQELPKFSENMPQIIADIIQVNVSDLMKIDITNLHDIAVQEATDIVTDTTDIVLLVPGHQDLENYSFPYMRDFISKLIHYLPLESNQYRLALVQYDDDVHEEFKLDRYKTKKDMLMLMQELQILEGGPVKIGGALRQVHERYFKAPADGTDRNQVLVVLSSLPSDDDVEEPAKMLQDNGVKVIALGIREAVKQQLSLMATQSFSYYFPKEWELPMFSQNVSNIIAGFQMDRVTTEVEGREISTMEENDILVLQSRAGHKEPRRWPLTLLYFHPFPTAACDRDLVADVVFIVDHGTSKSNFEDLKKFLQNLISSFDVKQKCIRIGLVKYTDEQQVVSLLNTDTHKAEILQRIQDLSAGPGKANTGAAINTTRLKLFTESAGSRKKQGVEQIAVLVTHRLSQDNVSNVAALLRRSGVAVFAIGVENASDQELVQIASYPHEQYVTGLKAFSDLQKQGTIFQKKILNQIQNKLYVHSERKEILKTGCVDTEEADIYLLVDGSSSLDYLDFLDMKKFLKEMIRLFNIGLNKVRFGLVQFSHINEPEFELNKYKTTRDLIKAIDNVRQIGGNTSTGGALTYMRLLFENARKQRGVTVPCHLVVLTDGESQDSVKEPAMKLREDRVNIYAIGVREANKTQLYEIAGTENRVYFVHSFDLLGDIKNEVIREICSKEACKKMKADIMFLVDSSASIGNENFLKMKSFMRGLVNKTDVGADRVQIGVVQFSHEPKEEFQLNTYSTKREIFSAIDRISPLQANTLTGEALKFMPKYFQASSGSRPQVKKILILVTDGEAQDEVKAPATALREEGIIIYSVGVFNANKTQLEEISGKREMVFYVENFDILKQIKSDLIFDICTLHSCRRVERLDIVFVIDSSGSISSSQYQAMKDFMTALVNKSDVSPEGVQFGALKYSHQPEALFYLNKYTTKLEITEAIQSDQPIGQSTYTAKALIYSETFFTEAHGSRKSRRIPQVLIVITDGVSHDTDMLSEVAQRLRNKGIIIYAVGVEGANRNELLAMAGSEDKCFYVDTFEGLENLTGNITSDICDLSPPHCPKRADIIFLMDGSRNIDEENFRMMKDFVKSVVDPAVTVQNTKIGIAQYSNDYEEEFSLGMFLNRSDLEFKIQSIKQIKGHQSNLENALEKVKLYFQPEKGSRIYENIQQILLIITAGPTTGRAARAAESLRKRGVDIYAIGMGNIDHSQLTQITGTPSRKYAVDNFSDLRTIKKRLVDVICEDDNRKEAACLVDITVGFDISSQREGHHLFHGQTKLEKHLPKILQALLSLRDVSCNAGSKAQSSVAVKVENTITPVSVKFHVDSESILSNLTDAVIKTPSRLNVEFLQSLWETFQNEGETRQKVLLVFSDGVDDDLEALEQKSEELKKKGIIYFREQLISEPGARWVRQEEWRSCHRLSPSGLDGLITVVLEGASSFEKLRSIEFGKGFEYGTHLDIGMTDIASRLSKFLNNIAERTCCSVSCKCIGEEGETGNGGKQGIKGPNGVNGNPGHFGDEGEEGPRGPPGPQGRHGNMGCPGKRGPKGFRGFVGKMGDKGDDGVDGIRGAEGSPGVPGKKGEKGDIGYLGSPGPRGPRGGRGQKGFQGDSGDPGLNNEIEGAKGLKGEDGEKGERGQHGSYGLPGAVGNTGIPGQRGQWGPEGNRGQRGQEGLQGKQGYKGPQGQKGMRGQKGQKGRPGYKGPPSEPGAVGPAGSPGIPGETGNKGQPGNLGPKGKRGQYGSRGRQGQDGASAYGLPGRKGIKGYQGLPGDSGLKGEVGDKGIAGENGPKGYSGRMGISGPAGPIGNPGEHGFPGRRGSKGLKGQALYSPCELIDYVRRHSRCWDGKMKCPLYPTELVFALDISRTVTPEIFERMREIVIAIVNQARIRDSNCPVGARVAVISYNLDTHYLIRFSEFRNKNKLLNALKNIPYQRSAVERDVGSAMSFIAKNVFKRTLQGPNVRKIAVVFSHGPAENASSVKQAVLEMSAVEVIPVVFAFEDTPHISQAFLMDDSGLFQVLNIRGEPYDETLQRFNLCTLCYDKCNPNAFCERPRPRLPRAYVDAAFVLDSSQKMSGAEFEKVKDFISKAITVFSISSDPKTSVVGDRIAVVSHALPDFQPGTGSRPVKKEFDLLTYSSEEQMRKYLKESLHQLNGEAAVGYAIQWAMFNIFSDIPNPRQLKVIVIVSAGKTSQWDRKTLKRISREAKCQGYALLAISLGKSYDRNELEELASTPLEQHLVQLGRIDKPALDYAMKFLKPFIHFLKSSINNYPPEELKAKCNSFSFQTKRSIFEKERMSADHAIKEATPSTLQLYPRGMFEADRKFTPSEIKASKKKQN